VANLGALERRRRQERLHGLKEATLSFREVALNRLLTGEDLLRVVRKEQHAAQESRVLGLGIDIDDACEAVRSRRQGDGAVRRTEVEPDADAVHGRLRAFKGAHRSTSSPQRGSVLERDVLILTFVEVMHDVATAPT
jgi:hypothetical protein